MNLHSAEDTFDGLKFKQTKKFYVEVPTINLSVLIGCIVIHAKNMD